jgi:hypothetical protein
MTKETKRAMGTDFLESADVGASENGTGNRASHRHSLPEELRRRNKSELQKKQSERRSLTHWKAQTKEQLRMAKETSERRALTNWGTEE